MPDAEYTGGLDSVPPDFICICMVAMAFFTCLLSLERQRRRAVPALGQAVADQAADVLEGMPLIMLSHTESLRGDTWYRDGQQ